MSEYWVSKKKYYCQYCEIYIADDVPSRSQHENGLRHKGNKDRFIRGLYKAGIKKKQESEEEKREMRRVEQAAQAAFARDVGSGLATSTSSTSSSVISLATPKPKPPPPKPSDPYANYTTAASLGFSDPDVERLVADAKMRKSEGRAGDWVAVVPPPPPLPQNGEISTDMDVKSEPGTSAGEVRKREDGPIDDEDTRHFKMRKKTVSVGLGEIYDPGIIQVKPRIDRNVKVEPELVSIAAQGPVLGGNAVQTNRPEMETVPKATEKPNWTRREWKWAGDSPEIQETSELNHVGQSHLSGIGTVPDKTNVATKSEESVKAEQTDQSIIPLVRSEGGVSEEENIHASLDGSILQPGDTAKQEDQQTESTNGGLFRKRKVPAGPSSKGRRKV